MTNTIAVALGPLADLAFFDAERPMFAIELKADTDYVFVEGIDNES